MRPAIEDASFLNVVGSDGSWRMDIYSVSIASVSHPAVNDNFVLETTLVCLVFDVASRNATVLEPRLWRCERL